MPGYVPPFELIDFMVLVERRRGRGVLAEATVKVRVGPKIMHTAAEGNGPVNALDVALRKALLDVYPQAVAVSSWSTTRCASSTAIPRPPPPYAC